MKKLQVTLIGLSIALAIGAHAANTEIADSPLNTGGVDVIRPNIVLIFDDSGSMTSQATPDWVDSTPLCYNGGATQSTTVGNTDPAHTRGPGKTFLRVCDFPDPPMHNPDINVQFYNPDIEYKPAVNPDLSYMTSMTAANTSNWTRVPVDAFKKTSNAYGYDSASGFSATSTVDLVNGYRSSYHCDVNDDNCAHDSTYNFPEVTDPYASTLRRQIPNYAVGRPHYYRTNVWEYCKDEDLTDCTQSTSPTGAYIYPSKLRYCTDLTYTNCRKTFSDATTPKFIYPNYLGRVSPASKTASAPGAKATATISVASLVPSTTDKITTLSINGTNFLGSGLSLNSLTTTSAVATAIKNALQANSSFTSQYVATVSSNVVTITAVSVGTSFNKPIVLQSTRTVLTPTKYRVIIKNARVKTLNTSNCLKSPAITLNGSTVSNNASAICDAGSSSTAFPISSLTAAGTSSGYTYVTGPTNISTNDMYVEFQKDGDASSGSCAVNVTSGGSTNIGSSSCAVQTAGTIGGATFQINGSAANNNVSSNVSGGVDATVGVYTAAYRYDIPQWNRTIIAPGNTYPKHPNRLDCAAADSCTFDEEMTNFANWYSYYRTRYQAAKTAAGQAFSILNDRYRVGYAALNKTGSMIGVNNFDLTNLTHRTAWYTRLYGESGNNATPLRTALSTIGRYYGGKNVTASLPDPIQYSCQKNYAIMVTDGYWNETNNAKDLNGNTITQSYDSTLGPYVNRETGVLDGYATGGTLADVAQYYYMTDLRSSMKNNVATNKKDSNASQHMNTYTMGLGIDGVMTYKKDYETSTTGDFQKIISGATDCLWTGTGVCNWPIPSNNTAPAVDDLWHAAVNGRGKYFSAKNPKDAADGLREALSDIVTVTGAAAASATSSPNVTQTDNYIYSTTYQTTYWDGEIIAQRINTQTGEVIPDVEWKASDSVNNQADALSTNSNARTLFTLNTSATGEDKKKTFDFSSLTATEKTWFTNRCATKQLSQCSDNTILSEGRSFADQPENMVNFLRGQNDSDVFSSNGKVFGYLDIYRNLRGNRLGDTVNSVPLFVNKPFYLFDYEMPTGYESYAHFKTRVASRPGVLYVGANDGMLHAFDGSTGTEMFGYVPRTTMPEMWKLASQNYEHQYYVDGSPVTMDVTDSSGNWRTIVVGGYRKGGAGYYGLDVTDPSNPKLLWEVCNSSALCNNVIPNMGLSFGNPVITRMPEGTSIAGKWSVLVTSGYNNVSSMVTQPSAGATPSGDGKGYLYVLDPLTGALLKTYPTGVGSTTTPSGLGKVTSVAPSFYYDATSLAAYAGDLLGNLWRFDLTKEPANTHAVKRITTLKDSSGNVQPITARIEIGAQPGTSNPILYMGTGKYLSVNDLADENVQSIYAIRDPYTITAALPNADERATGFLDNIRSNTCTSTPTVGCTNTNAAKPFVKQTVTTPTINGVEVRQVSNNKVNWDDNSGWYIDLPDTGERVSIDATLALGTLLISSNVVNNAGADACSVGGYSWLYQLDYNDGSSVATAPNNAAAYKVPGSLVVGNVVVRLPSGILKAITTTASGLKIPYGLNTSSSATLGKRMSWREIPQ